MGDALGNTLGDMLGETLGDIVGAGVSPTEVGDALGDGVSPSCVGDAVGDGVAPRRVGALLGAAVGKTAVPPSTAHATRSTRFTWLVYVVTPNQPAPLICSSLTDSAHVYGSDSPAAHALARTSLPCTRKRSQYDDDADASAAALLDAVASDSHPPWG